MSWLAAIPIIGDIIKGAENIIDQYVLDKDKAMESKLRLKQMELEYQLKLQNMEHEEAQSQLVINAEEAKNPSLFVSGWRPGLGWICVCTWAIDVLFAPILTNVLAIYGSPVVVYSLPTDKLDIVMWLTAGLAGIRAFDKSRWGGKK